VVLDPQRAHTAVCGYKLFIPNNQLAGNRAETAENEPILLGRRLICQIFALLSTKNEVPPN